MKKSKKLGVIVGKFQVPSLHEGHKFLIQQVLDRHEEVIIFVGTRSINPTKRLPLSFEDRKNMILDEFDRPGLFISPVSDVGNNSVWSEKLDEKIKETFGQRRNAVLYGSRDSFIQYYEGNFPTIILTPKKGSVSGTELREKIAKEKINSHDFRAGQIHAAHNRYPHTYPTVDVAIVDDIENPTKLLLGRKPTESKFRFPGGFDEPTSESYEATVIKEAKEETGCDIHSIEYITSALTSDWRYRDEEDKIKTLFFVAQTDEKYPVPGDDICELKWIKLDGLTTSFIDETVIKGHQRLLHAFLRKYKINVEIDVFEIKKDEKESTNHS